MSSATSFSEFVSNLAISNADTISLRYGELTCALNRMFRDTESKTANTLQIGSFGRKTGIDRISDLDMLYIMPASSWATYKDGKQSKLLTDTKDAIKARYPTTAVRVDRLVVTVMYVDFHIEVQPVFEQVDGSFLYPDTYDGGAWKTTKPREEMAAVSELDTLKNSNLRRLCKMTRAWKNKHGVGMGGLLIDTLAYNFLKSTTDYDAKSYVYYGELCRDFFEYLASQPAQEHYHAPGSGQRVRVKKSFSRKANKAHALCVEAIDAGATDAANRKWRKVFGRPFPAADAPVEKSAFAWDDTEEFIEDRYPVDIRYNLVIDCDVVQDGFRPASLREMVAKGRPLLAKLKLEFSVVEVDIPGEYSIEWKVLNRGEEARRRNKIRGQIVADVGGRHRKSEPTMFRGNHIVECYAIMDGVCVAKDRIDVPIHNNGDAA